MREEPDRFGWVGGTVDGKYRVDAVVGSGGFGVVYRAHHLGFDQKVALKCLRVPDNLTSADREHFREMFLAEGRLLHQLSRATAGIVQALDLGAAVSPTRQWTPYLVLEWLEGQPLSEILISRRQKGLGGLPLGEAVALLSPAARALAVAHAQGVAHRDVKPANLFLSKIGQREVLKVLDFGIAKVMAETESVTRAFEQTGASLQAFTARYGAPEQFSRRYGATGPWTDVFALGLVLVELVAGRPALEGADAAELFVQAADTDHRPTLAALGCDVPAGIEAVLERALAVDIRARFADSGQFWDALEAAARESGLPLNPLDPSSSDRPLERLDRSEPLRAEGFAPTELSSSRGIGSSKPAQPKHQRTLLAVAIGALSIGAAAAVFIGVKYQKPAAQPESEPTPPAHSGAPSEEARADSTALSPPPAPASAAATRAPPVLLPGVPQRDVPGGSVGEAALTAFRVLVRDGSFGQDLRGASASCSDAGLALCTEPQWQHACSAFPELAKAPSWTSSATSEGVVVRGGKACSDRTTSRAEERSPGRFGLCCERAIAMTSDNLQKAYLSTTAERILGLERVLNQRNFGALSALSEAKVLVDGQSTTQGQLVKLIGDSLKNSPELLITNERCDVAVQAQKVQKRVRRKLKTSYQTTGWTAECRQTAQDGSSASVRDVAYGFTANSKLREISTKPAE
jgi:serine/threonine protein kinase